METLLFFIFATIALISALFVVIFRNPLYSALSLVVTFFFMAGLFLLLGAELIAAVQVLVYAGAIMVLFLFVIMLLNLGRPDAGRERLKYGSLVGIGLAVLLIAEFGSVAQWASPLEDLETTIPPSEIGQELMSLSPDVPFNEALTIIEKVASIPITDPKARTTPIGIEIENLPWARALQLIVNANNLIFVRWENYIEITGIGTAETMGKLLFTDYLLPFEVASMILLVALIGAVVLAKRERPSGKEVK